MSLDINFHSGIDSALILLIYSPIYLENLYLLAPEVLGPVH